MARGRMINKVISLDEKVNALSDDTARLLFTWLIAHLDCEGRMHGDPVTVKSIVFPRRKISPQKIEKYLKELEISGLILRYFVDGNQYLWMKNFEKHQTGLQKSKEAQSQIPPFTPELLQSKDGVGLTQVETKVEIKEETKTKEEGSYSKDPIKEDVFEVYRSDIGELGEDMENELELAIKRFTASWVIDAIREAVLRKQKRWVYIAGILKNWERYGKDAKLPGRGKADPDKYIKSKYGNLVQR